MLRAKHCEPSDSCCINPAAHSAHNIKLQWIYAYDSSNDYIYWEWKDVEIVNEDEPDFEEELR